MTNNEDNTQSELILGESKQVFELESLQDNSTHVMGMLAQATRHLRIFSRDLDRRLFDNSDFIAACKTLALRSHFCRIEILLMNSRQITAQGHRLLNLARALSSRIEIRRPEKQFEKLRHFSLTVDGQGYIYRTINDRYEGTASYHDPRYCRELDKDFDTIWQRSNVDPELRSLKI